MKFIIFCLFISSLGFSSEEKVSEATPADKQAAPRKATEPARLESEFNKTVRFFVDGAKKVAYSVDEAARAAVGNTKSSDQSKVAKDDKVKDD